MFRDASSFRDNNRKSVNTASAISSRSSSYFDARLRRRTSRRAVELARSSAPTSDCRQASQKCSIRPAYSLLRAHYLVCTATDKPLLFTTMANLSWAFHRASSLLSPSIGRPLKQAWLHRLCGAGSLMLLRSHSSATDMFFGEFGRDRTFSFSTPVNHEIQVSQATSQVSILASFDATTTLSWRVRV